MLWWPRWCFAGLFVLLLSNGCVAVVTNCIPLTQLNASAPAAVQACCNDEWYNSYSGIAGAVPAGTKHVYCGSPSDRELDYQLARSNTSWYQYCLESSCPLDEGRACCISDTLVDNATTIITTPASSSSSPSPSPSPAPGAAGKELYPQKGAIWAIYMCPHTAPSTSLFGYNLTPLGVEPTATAASKVAPASLANVPASKLLAACPSVPEGSAPPALDTAFNFSIPDTYNSYIGLEGGKPHMLSIFRKPSLGAVKITLSVRLDNDNPESIIHDHVTITLDAPTPSVVAAVPTLSDKGARRRLLSSFRPKEAPELLQGARRVLHRAGGGGGGHGGGGGGRGRGRGSSNYRYAGTEISGRTAYNNETLTTQERYSGAVFAGVGFSQYYEYRGTATPYLASKRWDYPTPSIADPKDKIPYAVPVLYAATYLVNTSVVNTTYGFYGPSVFRANSTFQYVSDAQFSAAKGAPECTACANSTACCSSGLSCCLRNGDPVPDSAFANSNWIYTLHQPNRRATVLSCGLVQDFIATLPIYLPTNATSLRVIVHSVEAQATTASPACGDTAATLDPRDPPLFLAVLRADKVYLYSSYSSNRKASATATSRSLPRAAVAMLLLLPLWLVI